MKDPEDDCIRLRTDVWLRLGADAPVKVQTRKLCRDGVFLEFVGPIAHPSVEVIFPDGGDPAIEGNSRIAGRITGRWPDGVWVGFDQTLRSVSELLMRNEVALSSADIACADASDR
jgi:hypothetical protein